MQPVPYPLSMGIRQNLWNKYCNLNLSNQFDYTICYFQLHDKSNILNITSIKDKNYCGTLNG